MQMCVATVGAMSQLLSNNSLNSDRQKRCFALFLLAGKALKPRSTNGRTPFFQSPESICAHQQEGASPSQEGTRGSTERNERDALFRLWLSSRRHNPQAQTALHKLLTAHPKILQILKEFVSQRKSKTQASKSPPSAWERMTQRASR